MTRPKKQAATKSEATPKAVNAEVVKPKTRGRKPKSAIGTAQAIAQVDPPPVKPVATFTPQVDSSVKMTVITEVDVTRLAGEVIGAIAYGIGALFAGNQK